MPILIVPSLINRWYIVDLREGASLVGGLVGAGLDTFCLDWGIPHDEDRYTTWEQVVCRVGRAVRRVRRITGSAKVGVLGYCMGSTVAGIWAALNPRSVACFVNLAGPFDFAEGGRLAEMVDPRWFDVDAIADAGNVQPAQMQAGFVALRPTLEIAKWVRIADNSNNAAAQQAFTALNTWASDNIPFPAAAYRTYIRELYQENRLIRGTHRVAGRRVDLGRIDCPILTVVASRDTICPPAAALALADAASSTDTETLAVPGGHVGAVVGRRASSELYPKMASWLRSRLS